MASLDTNDRREFEALVHRLDAAGRQKAKAILRRLLVIDRGRARYLALRKGGAQ